MGYAALARGDTFVSGTIQQKITDVVYYWAAVLYILPLSTDQPGSRVSLQDNNETADSSGPS